jgi:hypothetical protein
MDVNVSIGDGQKMALTGAALVYRGGTDAIAPQMPRALLPPQQSIHRTGGNPLQLTGHYIATMQFTQLSRTVQFASQHRHQALAARLLENVPYFYQRCHDCRSVFRSPFSPLPQSWLKRVVQNPDQILPVQASHTSQPHSAAGSGPSRRPGCTPCRPPPSTACARSCPPFMGVMFAAPPGYIFI